MRLNAIDITPIKVTITNEEILADLTYPAPSDRGARRAKRRGAAVEALFVKAGAPA